MHEEIVCNEIENKLKKGTNKQIFIKIMHKQKMKV